MNVQLSSTRTAHGFLLYPVSFTIRQAIPEDGNSPCLPRKQMGFLLALKSSAAIPEPVYPGQTFPREIIHELIEKEGKHLVQE